MHDAAASDARKFRRIVFDTRGRLFSAASAWETRLLDLSLRGALVRRPADWGGAVGESCRRSVHLGGGVVISMAARIAFASRELRGLACEPMDMESFGHLERLLELNLGSPEVLDRELAALG